MGFYGCVEGDHPIEKHKFLWTFLSGAAITDTTYVFILAEDDVPAPDIKLVITDISWI